MTTKNNKVKVYGPLVNDLQIYLENRQMEESSLYSAIDFEETERNYGTGKLAGVVEVTLLTLITFGADIVKDFFKDYIKDVISSKKNHSAVYKLKNDTGEELSITINKLDMKEIKKLIEEFKGSIVEISSSEV